MATFYANPITDIELLRAGVSVVSIRLKARFVKHLGLHNDIAGTGRSTVVSTLDKCGHVVVDLIVRNGNANCYGDAHSNRCKCRRDGYTHHRRLNMRRIKGSNRNALGGDATGAVAIDARMHRGCDAVVCYGTNTT